MPTRFLGKPFRSASSSRSLLSAGRSAATHSFSNFGADISEGSRYSGTVTCWCRDSSERASRCVVSCYALRRALVYASFLSTPPGLVHPAIVDSYCCSNAVLTRRAAHPMFHLARHSAVMRRLHVTGIGADSRRVVGRASSDLRLVVHFGPCAEPTW